MAQPYTGRTYDICSCADPECSCDVGWCGCPQQSCETCGVKGYGTDGPYARQSKTPGLTEVDGLYYCETCHANWTVVEATTRDEDCAAGAAEGATDGA